MTMTFPMLLKSFDWEMFNQNNALINIKYCERANYQTMALLILYVWYLKVNGCHINVIQSRLRVGATKMWELMGAKGCTRASLNNKDVNFVGNKYKPLIAIRNSNDFKLALDKIEAYTDGFNVEYEKTLRYILSELLYNTLEHGSVKNIPSILQFSWYREKGELSFIVADTLE